MSELSIDAKKTLLKIARDTISYKLRLIPKLEFPEVMEESLKEKRGAFVTLHIEGYLRGCIGNFVSDEPLYKLVSEMAVNAAFADPRFNPLTKGELDRIDIEISALTPLTQVNDVEEICVGKHGIYLIKDCNRGVLLPQVATEYGWDRYQFLDQTCIKAGMSPGSWKDKSCKILIFCADIFGEKDFKA